MKNFSELAKQLRHNQTLPEQIIWHILRNRSFCNTKFRRQVQIGRYIVDFVSYEKMLIIELDGREHLTLEHIEYDNERTKELNSRGFKVIRYYNNDVLNNLEKLMEDLWNNLH